MDSVNLFAHVFCSLPIRKTDPFATQSLSTINLIMGIYLLLQCLYCEATFYVTGLRKKFNQPFFIVPRK